MSDAKNAPTANPAGADLSAGAYELIRARLQDRGRELQQKLRQIDALRKSVFGSIETKLLNTERVSTENNCVPRDIIPVGDHFILGYNARVGLKSELKVSDVFSVYYFDENKQFHQPKVDLLADKKFETDFREFYKYYKNASFSKFSIIGSYLYMVFQAGRSASDVKTFKWLLEPNKLTYLNNRSEQEVKYPPQYDFEWRRVGRDMRREVKPPLVSLDDKLYVGLEKGSLLFKVDDKGKQPETVYTTAVSVADQTLDDLDLQFAVIGGLVLLKIKPYREEKYRYLIYNTKTRDTVAVDTIGEACRQLPDGHGVIFGNGYYLQTGELKLFDHGITELVFEKRIASPNGEDFLYLFHRIDSGTYVLLPYNLIRRGVESPLVCHGFSLFEDGEMLMFRADDEPTKHHSLQIYSTPFVGANYLPPVTSDSFVYKIGNKPLVESMADSYQLLALLGKEDSYAGLYFDIIKQAGDISDTYAWLSNAELFGVHETLREIRKTAESVIEEFEKVAAIKKSTLATVSAAMKKADDLEKRWRHTTYEEMAQYVAALVDVRKMRGEIISLRELRYADLAAISKREAHLGAFSEELSRNCVEFLLQPDSLKSYAARIDEHLAEIEKAAKAVRLNEITEEVAATAEQLQALIEIVSNLKIEDATQTTEIIDNISAQLARLNQVRAALNNRKKDLLSAEGKAEFTAQLKLIGQAVVNYLDVADTPARCDEMLNKLIVQIEELGAKFVEYDEFIGQITDKRQEVYEAFEAKKLQLTEARNKRSQALIAAAERILKAVEQRAQGFSEIEEINGYFAADLMVEKARDLVRQLYANEDSVRAGDLEGRLKKTQLDALQQLKDKKELFVDGQNVIQFGEHRFAVNTLKLELTIIEREGRMFFHLTGTNFFEPIENEAFYQYKPYWGQALISETTVIVPPQPPLIRGGDVGGFPPRPTLSGGETLAFSAKGAVVSPPVKGELVGGIPLVYRGEYLAYKLFAKIAGNGETEKWSKAAHAELLGSIQQYMATRYAEGYLKGVTDHDAALILSALLKLHTQMDLLRFNPTVRACASVFWNAFISHEQKEPLRLKLLNLGLLRKAFPDSNRFADTLAQITGLINEFVTNTAAFAPEITPQAAEYLFEELTGGRPFISSQPAADLYREFHEFLALKDLKKSFYESLGLLDNMPAERWTLIRNWLTAFVESRENNSSEYLDEAAALFFLTEEKDVRLKDAAVTAVVEGLAGAHPLIEGGKLTLHYQQFTAKMREYAAVHAPNFVAFSELKKKLIADYRAQLKLDQFEPKVMSAFVRNQLIDQVYLPLIGANLAKQIGTVGENKRSDFQGLLLVISPPGYGKTTLMEYVANRLGLAFVKINGPALGHAVTSLDPAEAPNASARIEIQRLNLALEMGDNVMLYVDDIQHCNPEFLQKFISLCDAQRKIEGVYKGESKLYDLRGKKVCVVMAGNPYTESGSRFQVPDMLVNRADTYNLGDIIGNTQAAFELSYVENSLTSNAILRGLHNKSRADLYQLIKVAETGQNAGLQLEGAYSPEEINDYVNLLAKTVKLREVILKMNQEYIRSAAQADEYRTEPPFKLQGSYRNMSKLVDKIVPLMNEAELQTLIVSHYEQEAQTLTSGSEANLLKFKEICGFMTDKDRARWDDIKTVFRRNQLTHGFGGDDRMGQAIAQLAALNETLGKIREGMEEGVKK